MLPHLLSYILPLLDIFLVVVVFYFFLRFFRQYLSPRLLEGLLLFLLLFLLAVYLHLETLRWLLEKLLFLGPLFFVVVFQPELRRLVEKATTGIFFTPSSRFSAEEKKRLTGTLVEAAEALSEQRVGGLLVLEKKINLQHLIETGVMLNADLTSELLTTIFAPRSPLHDGAVIVRNGKAVAAACTLPLSRREDLAVSLGTRHRAALGVTETSDAIAIVVSEESSAISIAYDGKLLRNLSLASLRAELDNRL